MDWRGFLNLTLQCTARSGSKEVKKTNLDHLAPRSESNPVLFFCSLLCSVILNFASNRVSSLELCFQFRVWFSTVFFPEASLKSHCWSHLCFWLPISNPPRSSKVWAEHCQETFLVFLFARILHYHIAWWLPQREQYSISEVNPYTWILIAAPKFKAQCSTRNLTKFLGRNTPKMSITRHGE